MVWMTAVEALNILNVRPQTLYANVSRGKIRAKPDGDDPRRSLYHRDDVLRMARRANGRRKVEAVSAQAMAYGDPVLSSSISTADDGRLLYRGRDAATLAETASLEDIAALLWECCTQPHEPENGITRPADAAAKSGGASPALATATARAMATATTTATAMATATVAVPVTSASGALAAGLLSLAHRAAADAPSLGRPVDALRIEAADILATLVAAMSAATARNQEAMLYSTGSPAAPIATRLAHAWRCMPHEDLIRRTLVLMADHELNASTFTCRVAISTGASLAAGVLAGLATLSGPLHGGASAAFAQLAADAQRQGARAAVRAWLDQGRALPAWPPALPRRRSARPRPDPISTGISTLQGAGHRSGSAGRRAAEYRLRPVPAVRHLRTAA